MFERLIKSFGRSADAAGADVHLDAELQLAAAILLYGTLNVDHDVPPEETRALLQSLQRLLHLSTEKSHRLIARAAADLQKDASMMSSATLLKHRTPESFRENLMKAMQTVIYADGQVHDNERERVRRTERLLGLTTANLQKSA